MTLFSERNNHRSTSSNLQLEEISQKLKIRIWNIVLEHKLNNDSSALYISFLEHHKRFEVTKIWSEFVIKNSMYLPKTYAKFLEEVYYRYTKLQWFEVYDFIEFLICNKEFVYSNDIFIEKINDVLEKENSAYRILNNQITPIIHPVEINAIESTLENKDLSKLVKTHLKRALELLSDRNNPDYRNSIKESISAVESICIEITGDKKATLGQALKNPKIKTVLHSGLINGFSNIYGFTSNAGGIRHALLDETTLEQEDAIFMLVSCSAFVNYLKSKISA